jgi:hypothetical protein
VYKTGAWLRRIALGSLGVAAAVVVRQAIRQATSSAGRAASQTAQQPAPVIPDASGTGDALPTLPEAPADELPAPVDQRIQDLSGLPDVPATGPAETTASPEQTAGTTDQGSSTHVPSDAEPVSPETTTSEQPTSDGTEAGGPTEGEIAGGRQPMDATPTSETGLSGPPERMPGQPPTVEEPAPSVSARSGPDLPADCLSRATEPALEPQPQIASGGRQTPEARIRSESPPRGPRGQTYQAGEDGFNVGRREQPPVRPQPRTTAGQAARTTGWSLKAKVFTAMVVLTVGGGGAFVVYEGGFGPAGKKIDYWVTKATFSHGSASPEDVCKMYVLASWSGDRGTASSLLSEGGKAMMAGVEVGQDAYRRQRLEQLRGRRFTDREWEQLKAEVAQAEPKIMAMFAGTSFDYEFGATNISGQTATADMRARLEMKGPFSDGMRQMMQQQGRGGQKVAEMMDRLYSEFASRWWNYKFHLVRENGAWRIEDIELPLGEIMEFMGNFFEQAGQGNAVAKPVEPTPGPPAPRNDVPSGTILVDETITFTAPASFRDTKTRNFSRTARVPGIGTASALHLSERYRQKFRGRMPPVIQCYEATVPRGRTKVLLLVCSEDAIDGKKLPIKIQKRHYLHGGYADAEMVRCRRGLSGRSEHGIFVWEIQLVDYQLETVLYEPENKRFRHFKSATFRIRAYRK